MGVATLMQLVEYLGERRPKRTAVFNINNGEEDGLYGAEAQVLIYTFESSV
jgi:Zn-dependent M28 family amino/carboxypeptidase